MLSMFSKPRDLPASPLSPAGTKRRLSEQRSLTPDEEEHVQQVLDSLYTSLPRRQHAYVTEHYCGGANAIAFVESLTHGLATDGDVSVFFSGALENNPEEGEDARFFLHEYRRCFDGGAADGSGAAVMDLLSQLRGPFAFVVFDRCTGRIVAGRSRCGREPLALGTTPLDEGLLFASDKGLLEGECPDADDFPPGTIFVSEDHSTVGQLSRYAPDDAEAGTREQEALCRVESSSGLHRVPSTSQIEAN